MVTPKLDAEFVRLHRMPDPDLAKVKTARRMMAIAARMRGRRRSSEVTFNDQAIEVGARRINVRIYRANGAERPGVLVYFHGGGFIVGDLETEHEVCLNHARDGRCVVVSVDYRLAPEFPFPAAHDDGWEVMNWVRNNGALLNADVARLAVGGGSAGASIAAGLALRARDEGFALSLVLLQQPVVDNLGQHRSAREFNDTPFLKAKHIPMAWDAYFGATTPEGRALTYAAAFAAENVAGLADTLIIAGNCDPARDEAIAYARRLTDAGVNVDLHLFAGAPHGFDLVETAPAARAAIAIRGKALARAIGGAAEARAA
ncbi:alpha/beta hydrolase [Terricaulis silvestris]|uniref:Carboxylesterase NlhH n=1 Tax=Terricaulis silvestris TaxID=2686094 RepID=A0A6I6MGM1_9CAUL|nr:alpha/beta hydrolase [Terricaulis silvestris]QGZ93810.1 Carboxylesterase NlhH [Terricaulis silvestris]